MQLFATILSDVCYRLHGIVVSPDRQGCVNPRHHLKDLFDRRLKRGQCYRTPYLGLSEFTCSYWGPFREKVTEVDRSLTLEIPSMLLGVWNTPSGGQYAPVFCQNIRIVDGELNYKIPKEWLSIHDLGVKSDAK